MSKYLLNKFLYTVDRDPELVERYRDDPAGTVDWWERERANTLFIAMFERDHGPLEYQLAYARAMDHVRLPYPDIAT